MANIADKNLKCYWPIIDYSVRQQLFSIIKSTNDGPLYTDTRYDTKTKQCNYFCYLRLWSHIQHPSQYFSNKLN